MKDAWKGCLGQRPQMTLHNPYISSELYGIVLIFKVSKPVYHLCILLWTLDAFLL